MNYTEVIDALRRKANDSAVGEKEKEALIAKADELEEKYGKRSVKDKIALTKFTDDIMATFPRTLDDFPEEWYALMDEWDDTSDWYSGAEE